MRFAAMPSRETRVSTVPVKRSPACDPRRPGFLIRLKVNGGLSLLPDRGDLILAAPTERWGQ